MSTKPFDFSEYRTLTVALVAIGANTALAHYHPELSADVTDFNAYIVAFVAGRAVLKDGVGGAVGALLSLLPSAPKDDTTDPRIQRNTRSTAP